MGKTYPRPIGRRIIAHLRKDVVFHPREADLLIAAVTLARRRIAFTCKLLEDILVNGVDSVSETVRARFQRAFLFDIKTNRLAMNHVRAIYQVFDRMRDGVQDDLDVVEFPASTRKANVCEYEKFLKQALKIQPKFTLTKMTKSIGPVIDESDEKPVEIKTIAQESTETAGEFGYVHPYFFNPGRIHIDFKLLFNTPHSAWTLVHEASHKFAKTADKSYFNQDQNRFYKNISVAQALKNADSYAVFAMMLDAD